MNDRPGRSPTGDVKQLSFQDLERLGINSRNELYWDNRRVVTRNKLYLTFPQTVLAILAAVASLATIATGLNNASVFLCGRNIHWLGCPNPPTAATPPAPSPRSP